MVAVLVSESERKAASTFLLMRQLPLQIELAGTFFPADGYVLLQQHDDIRPGLRDALFAQLRMAGWQGIRKDIPDPAPGSAEAMAWHIEAIRHNWIGEFFPASEPMRREPLRVSA